MARSSCNGTSPEAAFCHGPRDASIPHPGAVLDAASASSARAAFRSALRVAREQEGASWP